MSESKRVFIAALLLAATCVVGVPTATADEPKDKPKVKKPEQPAAAEPGKTIIIQIDASKISPEMLKDLIKLSQVGQPTKPGVKPELLKPGSTKQVVKPGVKPEPTKPGVKPEPTKPGTKPELTKAITLSDAIAIAEKLTKGIAVKAEREDEDGKVEFEIEVSDGKGGKTEVVIDGTGKVLETKKKGEKDDEKGKKKKQDD